MSKRVAFQYQPGQVLGNGLFHMNTHQRSIISHGQTLCLIWCFQSSCFPKHKKIHTLKNLLSQKKLVKNGEEAETISQITSIF